MSTIVVTGADGFIGYPMCALLSAHGDLVRATVRKASARVWPPRVEVYATGDLDGRSDWSTVVENSEIVIHLAGRAHIRERTTDSEAAFHRVNVEAATALFRASVRAGVRRFVYISSIGVLGVVSGDEVFNAASEPHPTETYAVSKWQAERDLASLAASSPTELVIVRPTLVCGPGAKGNFERLVKLVKRKWPLPFASVRGRRNFVGISNLCDLLELCGKHPAAAGRTYLAADEATYSTPQLVRAIAAALALEARMLPCPEKMLRLAGALLGLRAEVERLTGSLLVDASAARIELGWRSARPLKEEIALMARAL